MTASAKYYNYIDGLRAIAVMAVVLYHVNPKWVPSGYLGVDVFFVVSGFVVSSSMAKFKGNFWQFLTTFYSRRFSRILPALLVTLMTTTIATLLFVPNAWLSSGNELAARSATIGLANYALLKDHANYFSPRAEFNPFTHTWSLGVEEQFYAVFPFVFFLWSTKSRRRNWFLLPIFILATTSLAIDLGESDPTIAFYSITHRFWELALGMITFQISQFPLFQSLESGDRWENFKTYAGSAALFSATLCQFIPSAGREKLLGVGTVSAIALMLFLFENKREDRLQKTLSTAPVRAIGRLSYSLYLFHWPLLVILQWTVGLHTSLLKLTGIAGAFLLATLSYLFIETPVRNSNTIKGLRPIAVILLGLAAVFITSKAIKLSYENKLYLSLSVTAKNRGDWYPEETQVDAADCESAEKKIGPNDWEIRRKADCKLNASNQTVFAIGDSHASGYGALFRQLAAESGRKIRLFTKGGCSYMALMRPHSEESEACQNFIRQSESQILLEAKPGDVLFLPSLRLKRFGDQWEISDKFAETATQSIEARRKSVITARSTLSAFVDSGMLVIFEAPKPIFRIANFRCSDWFNKDNPACRYGFTISRKELLKLRTPVMESMNAISEGFGGHITIWDPFDELCPESMEFCSSYRNGRPLFFDTDHLSGFGNRLLAPRLLRHLDHLSK